MNFVPSAGYRQDICVSRLVLQRLGLRLAQYFRILGDPIQTANMAAEYPIVKCRKTIARYLACQEFALAFRLLPTSCRAGKGNSRIDFSGLTGRFQAECLVEVPWPTRS